MEVLETTESSSISWDDVPPTVQQQLLEKYRNIDTDDMEWWDCVYDGFKAQCVEKGIFVSAIYFSGFSSQGDGACFEGSVLDWPKFLAASGNEAALKAYAWMKDDLTFWWRSSGRYCHEHSVDFTMECGEQPFDPNKEPLRFAAWKQVTKDGSIFYDLEGDLKEYLRGLMKGLYRDLEEEYEYLTSDEQISERLMDCYEDEVREAVLAYEKDFDPTYR